MKILITADPFIPVPPILYGGIERIIDMLIREYIGRGHELTLIAHPDSEPHTSCRFIPYQSDKDNVIRSMLLITKTYMKHRFDVIHSFSRLAYLFPLLPVSVPKIMSYQREPTVSQIVKANRLAKKNSLAFTGCSNYISNQIQKHAKAYTVYNGVPMETYNLNTHVPPDAPLIFLGRIEEIKGTHIAIEVAKRTNSKLIIAGNITSDNQHYFDTKVQPFLNDQIKYIGPVNDLEKNKLLQQAKAFLMPILWDEPFGIVMAEAMACGTPVIGFRRGSVPEVVQHGETGFVCDTLDEMISLTGMVRKISRTFVRQQAELRFSSQVIAEKYLKIYQQMQ